MSSDKEGTKEKRSASPSSSHSSSSSIGEHEDLTSCSIEVDLDNKAPKGRTTRGPKLSALSAADSDICWSQQSSNVGTFYEQLDGCRTCLESRGDCFIDKDKSVEYKVGLLYTNREKFKLKDFSSEVRATMDVEQFVHHSQIILDMQEVAVEDIIERMLERVLLNEKEAQSRIREAREEIFIRNSSMLMAKTIQGVSSIIQMDGQSSTQSTLNYDQSWLCALCKLPTQIVRRHMIITRFKQPVNMGENAQEVRLFMLIITPVKDKGTKNALETGRNFATMLIDKNFRFKLLHAKDEVEFKSLMMIKAQQLAKMKELKNRHKYILDAAVHLSMTSLNYLTNDDCSQSNYGPCPLKRANEDLKYMQQREEKFRADNKLITTTCNKNSDDVSLVVFNKHPRQSKVIDIISKPELATINRNKLDSNNNNNNKAAAATNEANKDGSVKVPLPHCYSLLALLSRLEFGSGLWIDFKRRVRVYPSDFRDAFYGPPKTIQKTVATIWFLYFSILLPTIAFSALNTTQTHGHMGDLRKAIIGQAIGGLSFAYFGGQPLVIIMTTAPLCLYTKVIHQMCIDYGYHFPAMYAAVGLWNGFFLIIYSLFGFSKLMKWCTRSTEEIFALFIVIAFITDASKDLIKNFNKYYYTAACDQSLNQTLAAMSTNAGQFNSSSPFDEASSPICRRETSLLFVLLMLGTLWLATSLYRFKKTPYLEASKRELLADYALPAAVIAMSFFGSFIFDDIFVEKFPPLAEIRFERAPVELLPLSGILTSLGLGFTLSLLFFMDQNISAAMVNAPQNRLKKGCAYHFDLLVVGILNGFLTIYGLPMMHGVLPHSPLHVRSLADIEERVEEGHLQEVIVNVRETRVTGIVSHILILGSLLLIPYPIAYIPTAVLNGLFLYMAVTSLDGLQMFERILLLFTEQSKYPPNHYIRRCPQRKIHQFTLFQLFQLVAMCLFGFSPFNIVEMFFPVIILLMIPFRHKVVTKYIDTRYLNALDGKYQ